MADVAGKGIPAALLVAALHASVFSLAKSSLTLRMIVGRTNQLLYESVGETRYATFFFGLLDVPLRRLIHINAGHPPPILVRASGEIEWIHASGLPVGLFPAPRYFEEVVQLGDGDLLAFYTDGITESANRKGDLFGRDRLAEALRRERDRGTPAAEVCDSVLKAVRRFPRRRPRRRPDGGRDQGRLRRLAGQSGSAARRSLGSAVLRVWPAAMMAPPAWNAGFSRHSGPQGRGWFVATLGGARS